MACLDPDPLNHLNPDPGLDPDPKHCDQNTKKSAVFLTCERTGAPSDAPDPEDCLRLVGDVKRLLIVHDHVLQGPGQVL